MWKPLDLYRSFVIELIKKLTVYYTLENSISECNTLQKYRSYKGNLTNKILNWISNELRTKSSNDDERVQPQHLRHNSAKGERIGAEFSSFSKKRNRIKNEIRKFINFSKRFTTKKFRWIRKKRNLGDKKFLKLILFLFN